ncbi:mitochondrial ribosomal protein L37-domain-containing protein [Podospora fimiseda]|uniref:Large ribosomal subunit protein mL54 n=1 Tax=Podospora fimiseda TaxID=252190 RepID=A0AAN7BTU8_9PEZI|nr:mitochondrial ribosomal protein L37-domain-containing protein [Podospora fimiseda]
MICRSCLRRASALTTRQISSVSPLQVPRAASFSTTLHARNATAAAPESSTPEITPLTSEAVSGDKPAPLSSCPAGTVLSGLTYFKGQSDPVALPDEAYPPWLWKCLDAKEDTTKSNDAEAADEYSKSKKQRRLAAKRARDAQAKLLASGDLEALAPKVPLSKQSINLPGGASGKLEDALAAADSRENLRKAMRKERRQHIKESNYLKSM